MTKTKIPIWLDCDPGHDDAIAVLLGCFHPAFDILGISACYGNSSPENTYRNARSLLTAIGKAKDVPVYQGAQRPWKREPVYAPDIHGASGLDGTTLLPEPIGDILTQSYLDAVEEAVMATDGELAFISTGAVTSIATILKKRPHLKKHIRYISIMGGGLDVGNINVNKSAEFNIWVDPDAANSLFADPEINYKCILTPLDLTHKAIASQEVMKEIQGSSGSNLRKMFYDLFQFFSKSYKNAQGFETGPPVHDPITLIPLLELYGWETEPDIRFIYKRYDIEVLTDELSSDLGKLTVENEFAMDENKGVIVGVDLNFQYFWKQVYYVLEQAEKLSTIEVNLNSEVVESAILDKTNINEVM